MTYGTIPAPCKGHGCQGPGKDDDVHETPKGRTLEIRHQAWPKRNNGIKDQGLGWETFYEALGQIIKLEVLKQRVTSSIRVRSGSSWRVITMRNKPWGRKARPNKDVTSIALGKEEMVVCQQDIQDEQP
jgi:hypothetical protein